MSGKRLSGKDNYGYSSVLRNEARHTHDGPEVAPHRKKRRGKNSPCKKAPDKLHSYMYVSKWYTFGTRTYDWGETKCIHCGKRR